MNEAVLKSDLKRGGWIRGLGGIPSAGLFARKSSPTLNIVMLNILFCVFYWVMESVRDVFLLKKGRIFERIFTPDAMSFWMRILVIFIFILFSVYSHALRKKIEVKKVRVSKSVNEFGIIFAGFGFGLLYWALEAFRDVFVFNRGDFFGRFFIPDHIAFWMRMLIVLILVLFSIHVQSSVNERHKAEAELKGIQDELEREVQARTEALQQEIAERRRAEEEKEHVQEQLLQAHKMEAVGSLAGSVAHDFNNLLTAIQGWTELLFRGIDNQSPAYQDLEKIQFAVKRATDLTQQLLYVSRKKPMRRVPVDLNDLVTGFMQICQRLIGENIAITAHFADDLKTMRADPSMIEQIVMNLVVNARDAMPRGGKIVIRTGNAFIGEAECRNDLEARPGKFVRLTVSDNGTGMNPQILQRIFEPFYTTKAVGKGTGLGLSVIYGIVKQHSGWIKVQSEPGKGTAFDVYLPAMETEKNEDTKAPDAREMQRGHGERILVVEDEANLAEFIKKALSRNGYTVFLACTISEARKIFKDEDSRFDLVFCDVVLPDGNGIDLIDIFKRVKPGLPVILSSGYSDHKLQLPLIEKRGYRFLKKPYTMLELMQHCQKEMMPDRRA